MQAIIQLLHEVTAILREMPKRLNNGRYFRVAASLSFTSLLALVPLVTVVFSTLSLFPVFERWSGDIEGFLYSNLVPQLGDQVQKYLHDFSSNAGQLTIWGLVFLIGSSLALLSTIEDVFNEIWHVDSGRPWVQRLLVYWSMLTLGPLLIASSLSISSYLLSLSVLEEQAMFVDIKRMVLRSLPILFELLAFMLFYVAIPNREVRLRHALIGAIVATILFEFAKYGFGFYLLHFNSYQRIYGTLAILPIFLVWVYLSWLVVLIGAYVAALIGNRKRLAAVVQES